MLEPTLQEDVKQKGTSTYSRDFVNKYSINALLPYRAIAIIVIFHSHKYEDSAIS